MAKKSNINAPTDDDKLDGFARQVEQALEHFTEPEWLGANSRLATPFVFGQIMGAGNPGERIRDRGIALQEALQQASEQLSAELHTFILDLYFQRNRHYTNVARAMKRSMSERTFYRRRQQAIQRLAELLYDALLPPLRSERPPVRPIVGRSAILQETLSALSAGETAYLSGPSGIGKTILSANIAHQWPHSVFWFTIRAGLTDRLASFVFAFAFYLRSQGASATWRQLIADQGLVRVDQTLSLLRYDLARFQETPLLLCIDDVDTLVVERSDHAQFLHLLDEMRSHVRLLLIGQHIVLEADRHFALRGFDEIELAEWLALAEIHGLDAGQRSWLQQATNGNPALLALLMTLHSYGDDLLTAASSLTNSPSLEHLLTRVWRRLDESERHILMEAATFRTTAPEDTWRNYSAVVNRLIARGLLLSDGRGGVECDQHIRLLVYERIPPELRRACHLHAATVLEEHGEFVRALYHYIEGNQPSQAIWLWFRHRTQQIERGQGPAALALLDQIAAVDLANEHDQAALRLARAELLKLVGRPEAVAEALTGLHLGRSRAVAGYAQQLLADALEQQGDIERSLTTYRNALETLMGSIPLRQVVIYQKLSYLHIARLPDLAAAQREALQALFHAEIFAANVDELRGNLSAARARYIHALEIANQVDNNLVLLNLVYSYLGKLLLKAGEVDAAVEMIQRTLALSDQHGDVMGPLYDRINLAYALTIQGRHTEALAMATDGLDIAERMKNSYLIAGLSAAAADAARHQRDMEEAELYATRSLIQEEEFFRPWALTVLGLAQAGSDRIPAALTTLHMALESAKLQEDLYGVAYALEALGNVCWQNGDRLVAKGHFDQALHLYQENGFLFEADRLGMETATLGF